MVKGGNKSGDVIVDSEGNILIKKVPLSSIEQGKNDNIQEYVDSDIKEMQTLREKERNNGIDFLKRMLQ